MKKPRSYKLGLMTRRSLSGWLFILPFLIGLIFFVISPLYTALVLSFNEQVFNDVTQITSISPYGFKAYIDAFTEQADYINKLIESGSSVLITVPSTLIFSFLMANVLNQEFRGRTFARAVLFMPVITSAGIAASLLAGDTGVDASQMDSVGSQTMDIATSIQDTIGGEMGMFIGTAFSKLTQIINGAGVPTLIFLAGLQTISPSIFESSKVEGATGWENFWKITFPMISPMILVNTVYILIENLCSMSNPMLTYLYSNNATTKTVDLMAMSWMYFLLTSLIIAAVAGIISKLVYYEN
ncbi:MAG: sugar ABC transporter permease [Clostridiales bacterium]|nr:sugar ABC transporter permease [Clostridiales bacterium]